MTFPTASRSQGLGTGEFDFGLVPYAAWVITPPWSLESYLSIGLANGSLDVGVGSQLGYTW